MRWRGAMWVLLAGACVLRAPGLAYSQARPRPAVPPSTIQQRPVVRAVQTQAPAEQGDVTPEVLPTPPPVPPRRPLNSPDLRVNVPGFDRQVSGNWTLDELTRLAMQYNPVLRRSQARIEAARGTALQAGIWANPRWDTNNPQVLGVGQQNLYNAGFQMDIPMAGKKRLDRSAAEQQITEAVFSFRSDRYDVLQSVRQAFIAVVAQEWRVTTLQTLVNIARASYEATEKKFPGVVAEIDVLPLQLEFQRAQAELLQAETLLVARRRQLASTVGAPDLPIATLRGDLRRPVPRFDDAYIRQYVVTQNVDVLNAQTEVNRTRILLTRAEVEPYPNIYTGPAAQWGAVQGANQFWYNFQFNIPVWDRNQGNIRAARANIRDASSNVRVTQNKLLSQAADALGRHRAAVRLADKIGSEILPTAERYRAIAARGREAGLLSVLILFNAQRAFFEANLQYISALEDSWTTAAELANLLQMEDFPQ